MVPSITAPIDSEFSFEGKIGSGNDAEERNSIYDAFCYQSDSPHRLLIVVESGKGHDA